MLTTQFLDAGPSGFLGASSGFGDLGSDPTAIKLLQLTLKNAGKSGGNINNPNGVMDGFTLAASYEIIRDKGGAVGGALASLVSQGASSSVQDAFKALQDLDGKLSQVPGVSLSIPSLLRDSTLVSQVVSVAQAALSIACNGLGDFGSVCSTATDVVNKLQNALNKFFAVMSDAAPTLNKVMKVLVPDAANKAASQIGTTTAPKPKLTIANLAIRPSAFQVATTATTTPPKPAVVPGTIYAFSKKLGKFRVAVPKTPIAKAAGFGGIGIMSDGAFGGQCIFGDCGLGADATFVETAPQATAPAAPAVQTTETDLEKKTGTLPFFKKPLFWIATIGGVAVVGGGGYWLMRRRKKTAAAPAPAAAKAAYY